MSIQKTLAFLLPVFQNLHIPFQITGGLAAHIYGSNRPINDIDIDVPEDRMQEIIPYFEKYIIFGPGRYRDDKWDLQLITLDYDGQEVDLGGAFQTKIFDNQNQLWINCPVNFATTEFKSFLGMNLPLINPHELIVYKKLLTGDHQKEDIIAITKYIKNHEST